MNLRQAEIAQHLTRWLDRYSVPQHLRDKPEAAQAEAESLARVLTKFAPQSEYVPFLNRAFDRLDYQMKTRAWPTVSEVGAVCSNLRKEVPQAEPQSDAMDMRPFAIAARRMQRGEAVGEAYLWGICAVEMIAERLVDEPTMRAYRSGAFFARKNLYGQESALAWEAEAKARHEAAKDMFRARNEAREHRGVIIPDKTEKPHWVDA